MLHIISSKLPISNFVTFWLDGWKELGTWENSFNQTIWWGFYYLRNTVQALFPNICISVLFVGDKWAKTSQHSQWTFAYRKSLRQPTWPLRSGNIFRFRIILLFGTIHYFNLITKVFRNYREVSLTIFGQWKEIYNISSFIREFTGYKVLLFIKSRLTDFQYKSQGSSTHIFQP